MAKRLLANARRAAAGAALAVGLGAAPTPALAFLDTEEAWNRMLQFAVRQINAPGEFEIELGRVTRPEDGFALIDDLKIKDGDGVWLTADDLLVDWNPAALLRGRFTFETLSAKDIELLRAPISRGDPPAEDGAELRFEWPRPPVPIVVDTMRIDRIAILGGLLPQDIEATMEGRFFDEGDVQETALTLRRLDRPGDKIDLGTRIDFDEHDVSISLDASEAPGGLVGALAGLPEDQAIELTLAAAGDPDALPFTLYADIGQIGIANGDGVARWGDLIGAQFEGRIEPGEETSPRWRTALGEAARISLDAQETAPGAYRLERLTIDSEALALDGAGEVDVGANTIDMSLDWAARDIAALNAFIAPARLDALSGFARATGRLTAPKLDVEASVDGLEGGFGAVEKLALVVESAPEVAGEETPGGLQRFRFQAGAEGLALADAALQEALGPEPRLSGDGAFNGAEQRLILETLTLDSETLNLGGKAEYAFVPGALDAELSGAAQKIGPFARAAGLALDGAAVLALNIDGLTSETVERLFLSAQMTGLSSDDPAIEAAIGEAAKLEALAVQTEPGVVEIDRAFLESAALSVTADGSVSIPQDAADLSLQWTVTDAQRLAPLIAPARLGAASGAATLTGALSEPEVALDADLAEVGYNDFFARTAALKGTAQQRKDRRAPFDFDARLTGVETGDPRFDALLAEGDAPTASARGLYDTATGLLSLDDARLSIGQTRAAVSGDVHLRRNEANIAYDLAAPALERFSGLIGEDLSGSLRASGRIDGPFSAPLVSADAQAERLRFRQYGVEALDLDLQTEPAESGAAPFTLALTAQGPRTGDPALDSLLGSAPELTASGAIDPQAQRLRLDAFKAALDALDASGSGDVDLKAKRLTLDYDLDARDLSGLAPLIGEDLSGSLRASGRVAGPFSAPLLSTDAQAENLRFRQYGVAALDLDLETGAPENGAAPFTLALTARAPSTGDPALDSLLGSAPELTASGAIDPQAQRLRLDGFKAALAALDASGSGDVDLKAKRLTLDYDLDARDLSGFSALIGEDLAGSLRARGRAQGPFDAPAVTTTLSGRGLRFRAYSAAALDADIEAAPAAGGALPFRVSAQGQGLSLGDPKLDALLEGAVRLDARGAYDPPVKRLRIDALTIAAGEALSASASGTVDLAAERFDLDFAFDARSLEAASALAGAPLAGALRADGGLEGSFAAPKLDLSAAGEGLRFDVYGVGLVNATLAWRGGEGPQPFSIDAAIAQASLGDPKLEALIGPDARISARGTFDQGAQRLRLDASRATAAFGAAEATGLVDLGARSLDLAFVLDATDLSPASALAGKPVAGALNARGTAVGPFAAPALSVSANGAGLAYDQYSASGLALDLSMTPGAGPAPFALDARLSGPDLGDPALTALLGPELTARARGRFDGTAQRLTLDDAAATGAFGALSASGLVDLGAQTLDLNYALDAPDLGVAQGLAGKPLAGAARLDGRLSGPFADPATAGTLSGSGLAYDAYAIGGLDARFNLTNLATGPAGDVDLDARTSEGPLRASAAFDLRGDGVRLDRFDLNGLGATASGALTLRPDGLAQGRIALDAADLAPLARLANREARGALRGTVSLEAPGGRQSVVFDLTGSGLAYFDAGDLVARAGTLQARGRVDDARGATPYVDASGFVAEAEAMGFPARRVDFSGRGPLSGLEAEVSGLGGATGSERLDAAARLALTGFPRGADIRRLALSYQGARLTLAGPMRVTEVSGGGWRMEGLDARLDDGEIVGAGEYSPAGIVADLRMRNVPMQLLRLAGVDLIRSGRLAGELSVDTRGAPRGRFDMTAGLLRLKGAQLDDPFDLSVSGTLDGRALDATASMTSAVIHAPVTASARIPLQSVAGAPVPQPDMNAPFSAQMDWSGDISEFWPYVPAPDHILSGPVVINARAAGTLSNPSLSGGAALTGGVYQHIDFGTLLTGLDARADFTQDGRAVLSLDARDGVEGTLTGRGEYDVGAQTLDAALSLDNAALARRDDVTALLSGEVTARGGPRKIDVTGRLRADYIEFRLIGGYGGGLVEIDVIPVGETAPIYDPPEEVSQFRRLVALDVTLDFPQQVFVRGRGLESEWGGRLAVSGDASAPRVVGLIQKRRGWFDLIGRAFDLERGEVRFSGPLEPYVRVRLQRSANDITGWVDVEGTAPDALEIDFGSNSGLPEDEVLPRLLFGRSKQSLSALEAAQLAAGINTLLSGKAGALDTVRGALGVDVLRVEGDDAGGTSVSTGKYVADGVFVGAKQNIDTGQSAAVVEIEVFDNIEIEAELSPEESKASGVWKQDY